MAEKKEAHHGKQPNQKMKPFIVMQYLQRNTDENHTCSSTDIIDYLNNECGISADRRSIYTIAVTDKTDCDDIMKYLKKLDSNISNFTICILYDGNNGLCVTEYAL